MKAMGRIAAVLVVGGAVLWAGSALTQSAAREAAPAVRIVPQLETRAAALLERAVEHAKAAGEAGLGAFNSEAAYFDRDLYVYAFRMDGEFLASGGFSVALIGSNVLDYVDTDGKAFFREMVTTAREKGEGRVEYKWFNPADSRGEPKVTLFRRVGDLIVAVGYFSPRATPTQAKAMLGAAAKAVRDDQARALKDFQLIDGRFIRDDLYVFAVDLADGRFLAHGASPQLIGTDARELRDPQGKPIIAEMIQRLEGKESAELDYLWVNPVSRRTEAKHSYVRRVGGLMVGVGYYQRK